MSTVELPEVAEWFVRQRFDDGVVLVTEPHVHPFLRCNVWVVEGGDRHLVIDTAMGIRPLRPFVERELDGALLAVATHSHPDHVGGLHEFDRRAIHADEAEVVAAGALASVETMHYGADSVGVYEAAGHRFGRYLVDAQPAGGLATVFEIAAAEATQLLVDGDVIDLGGRRLEVLHLPGHSPGSIGLWEAATGTLFSGDAVYDGPLLDGLQGSDVAAYVATMSRLRDLPVRVVHGGHERSFGRDRLIEICEAYLAAHA